jgi:hypothetical protein
MTENYEQNLIQLKEQVKQYNFLPNDKDTIGNDNDGGNFILKTVDGFETKYKYIFLFIILIIITVGIIKINPKFINTEQETVGINNIKYKSKKLNIKKLGILVICIFVILLILYFLLRQKINQSSTDKNA